jgi:hypothetical protein
MAGTKSNNEFDSLETFFNSRLKDASLEPSPDTWMQIEEELNKLEKEKRRRRFIWFFSSGLLLICGLATLWMFMPKNEDKNKTQNTTVATTQPRIENTKSVPTPNTSSESITENKKSNETIAETKKNENPEAVTATIISSNQKIQLGAFKHKADLTAFNKIPYKVIEVNGNDGYTRYFAETNVNETNALEKIEQAGFTGAFIKKNFNEADEIAVIKNEGIIETSSPVYVAAGTNREENNNYPDSKQHAKTAVPIAAIIPSAKTTSQDLKNETKVESETKNETTINPAIAKTGNPPIENPKTETKQEETKVTTENQASAVTKLDSVVYPQGQVIATENKTDSLPKKEEFTVMAVKKDSSILQPEKPATDTIKKIPFIPEFAFLFTGGLNSFSSGAQSNMYATSNEKQANTFNGEAKFQYRPFKYFSFSGGLNFTNYTAKQDATYFKFNKRQTEDYKFYSSFGSMAVPMTTMLDGYYFNAPTDTFFAKYSYTSTVQTINIPIEANLHFLNTKWVSLYFGLGANTSLAIAQQTHFTLIKENFNNDANYNNIGVNKINMALMMSLGCDVRITKHWYFTLNPSYKYGLTNMSAQNGTTYKPSFFSGNAGVKFKF